MIFYFEIKDSPQFFLKNSNGDIDYVLKLKDPDTTYCLNAELYETTSRLDGDVSECNFVADIYFKWDWCSHWNFYGESYDPKEPEEKEDSNSYYHLCGSFFQTRFMAAIAFVRRVALELIGDKTGDYDEKSKKVDDLLLEGYTIERKNIND